MEHFLIINAKDLRKNANFVVLTLQNVRTGKVLKKDLIRTKDQFRLDLENSGLTDDNDNAMKIHASQLIGAIVIGNIKEYAAGSTYIADETSSACKTPAVEEFTVIRNGKKEVVPVGGVAVIGDVLTRRDDATRLEDGFLIFQLTPEQSQSIALSVKSVVGAMKGAFENLYGNKSMFGNAPAPAPVATPAAETPEEGVEDEGGLFNEEEPAEKQEEAAANAKKKTANVNVAEVVAEANA